MYLLVYSTLTRLKTHKYELEIDMFVCLFLEKYIQLSESIV